MDREKNNNLRDEELMKRIERQLDDIETSEIIHDMSPESLEEKGFLGTKAITIKRSSQKPGTERESLCMAEGVDFMRLSDSNDLDSLSLRSLLHLKPVNKGQLIASRGGDDQSNFGPGRNIRKNLKESVEYYYPEKNGYAVIHRNALHVIPSDMDCSLRITVAPDKMRVFMDCLAGLGNGTLLHESLVKAELQKAGIRYGVDNAKITDAVNEANSKMEKQEHVIIAQGLSPVQGLDGKVDYTFDTQKREYDFRILPDGKIDYRNSTSILMAQKDMLLARIIDPLTGKAGVNVFGETVPAKPGKPASCTAGSGVRKSENGKELYAEIGGSIMLNGTVLEVVDTYVVNGDVGFSTGNIQFNGTVIINGTVPDGFEVKADGDIVVFKIVESARLEAGRDIIIKGGIQGKGKGLVYAGRDLHAGYAQNARLEAEGNIYVDNFAINSYICTTKSLIMRNKKGAVIGGEVFALRGIDVRILGSETGVKTLIDAGNDYLAMRRLSELDGAISFIKANIRKIEESLRPLFKKIKFGEAVPESMKPLVAKAVEKRKNLERRVEVMAAKRSDLSRHSQECDSCIVKVSHACYPDVMIKIKEMKKSMTSARENVRFYEDKNTGDIAVSAY
jgi:uncharacterized protein (DUF342 family)